MTDRNRSKQQISETQQKPSAEAQSLQIEKLAFEIPDTRGLSCKAWYLREHGGDALIEVFRNGEPFRRFLWPAYKIWNISAHWNDIVDSEENNSFDGYDLAGWTGFNVIHPISVDGGQ